MLLALALGVFHRQAHAVSVQEALAWSVLWISLGLGFAGVVYAGYENHWAGLGSETRRTGSSTTVTAAVMSSRLRREKSLSVDNIFVIP